ncbi:RiPP maturation radical SAM C-methyltransferase [Streptosporangiaceae bacterium NEAU-GS5]|nr:RiPP maturation radical SAM C-methyltransferase [Streptosporangiaceae bacterium NEAU-GS5]
MARIVLCALPFQSVRRPSLGLSLLGEVLRQHGHTVEVRYLNVKYARRVGIDLYTTISEDLPADRLFGDLLFSPVWLDPADPDREPAEAEIARYAAAKPMPAWLCEAVPALFRQARELVREESEAIAAEGFDLAGFSTTFNLAPSLSMARHLKAADPALRVVLGGASCEAEMGATVIQNFPYVDYVCPGEGERALVNLAAFLAGGGGPDDTGDTGDTVIPGMLSRRHPKFAKPVPPQDLDALPVPRYDDWLDQLDHADLGVPRSDLLVPIETSRGCWYGAQQHCTFCGLNGETLKFRSKRPDSVMREIDAALSYGIPNIHAVDNILDFRYFRTVLPELARRRHSAHLFYEIKSKVTRDQMALMRQAGIRTVQPGIESMSTPVLNLMRKGVQAYHNIRLLKWGEELGIAARWNILYGFPRERAQDFHDMFAMLPKLFHLQPPDAGRVRLDRFSPLHFDGPALGVAGRSPAPAYEQIYDLPLETLDDLAYYFEFEADDGNDPEEYGVILKAIVADWRAAYETSALLRADTTDGCHVFDTRPCATTAHRLLDPMEADLLRRADRGARPGELLAGFGAGDADVAAKALDGLLEAGWLLEVDDRVLSLAPDYTPLIPRSTPPGLLEDYCLERAAVRHRAFQGIWTDASADRREAETLRARHEATVGGGVR